MVKKSSLLSSGLRKVLQICKDRHKDYIRHFSLEHARTFFSIYVGLVFFTLLFLISLFLALETGNPLALLASLPAMIMPPILRQIVMRPGVFWQQLSPLWFDLSLIGSYIAFTAFLRLEAILPADPLETGRFTWIISMGCLGLVMNIFGIYPLYRQKFFRDSLLLALQLAHYSLTFQVLHVSDMVALGFFHLCGTLGSLGLMLAYQIRFSLIQKFQSQKTHSYREFSKILYRHQVSMIDEGQALQDTMPQGSSHACVISFDIQGSSQIGHDRSHRFFSRVMKKCNKIMLTGYDGKSLVASAYRIKEMGDGFLCSVGFPFQCPQTNFYNEAVSLAQNFLAIFQDEARQAFPTRKVYCGMGISYGEIHGMYPSFGALEYECYGHAIVLATRYEKLRKTMQRDGIPYGNIIILQAAVHQEISDGLKELFSPWSIPEHARLPEDPEARSLYYLVSP